MDRRNFLASGALLSLGALNPDGFQHPHKKQPTQHGASTGGLDLLGKPYDPQVASLTYNPAVEAGEPPTPNGLLFYDKGKKAFVSPTDIEPTKEKGNYSIGSTLRAFNISNDKYSFAQKSQQEIQIGLNFTAPITSAGDNFAWILKNAINIFLGKADGVTGALASFKSANPQNPAPAPTAKVQVLQGGFDLQVNAFFQKKAGFWRKLFQSLGGAPGSPLLATLGIPGIALAGVDFVLYSLNKLTQSEPLIPLWNPQPLPFALTKDVKKDFNFQEGLWCIVDSSILKSTNRLKGYSVDIEDQTYQVIDSAGKPLNANYIVADFDVKAL